MPSPSPHYFIKAASALAALQQAAGKVNDAVASPADGDLERAPLATAPNDKRHRDALIDEARVKHYQDQPFSSSAMIGGALGLGLPSVVAALTDPGAFQRHPGKLLQYSLATGLTGMGAGLGSEALGRVLTRQFGPKFAPSRWHRDQDPHRWNTALRTAPLGVALLAGRTLPAMFNEMKKDSSSSNLIDWQAAPTGAPSRPGWKTPLLRTNGNWKSPTPATPPVPNIEAADNPAPPVMPSAPLAPKMAALVVGGMAKSAAPGTNSTLSKLLGLVWKRGTPAVSTPVAPRITKLPDGVHMDLYHYGPLGSHGHAALPAAPFGTQSGIRSFDSAGALNFIEKAQQEAMPGVRMNVLGDVMHALYNTKDHVNRDAVTSLFLHGAKVNEQTRMKLYEVLRNHTGELNAAAPGSDKARILYQSMFDKLKAGIPASGTPCTITTPMPDLVTPAVPGSPRWGNIGLGLGGSGAVVAGGMAANQALTSTPAAQASTPAVQPTASTPQAASSLSPRVLALLAGAGVGAYGIHRWLNPPKEKEHKQAALDRDLRARIAAANAKVATPTLKEIESGTYQKGHYTWKGFPLTIETSAGQTRSGVDKDGKAWSVTLSNSYGYIKGTDSAEPGDQMDIFMGNHPESEVVFVVDQNKQNTKIFDEHKIVAGERNMKDAKALYIRNYSTSWNGFRDITPLTLPQLRSWLRYGDMTKPLAGQQFADFHKRANSLAQ